MPKKVIKASQKVRRNLVEEKKHFRLYKAGKLWLVAGLATLSFATSELGANMQDVHADTATNQVVDNAQQKPASATALKNSAAATSATSAPVSSASASTATSVADSSTSSAATSSATSSATSATSSSATSSSSSKADSASSSKADSASSSEATSSSSSKADSASSSKADSSAASKASSASTTKKSSAATSSSNTNNSKNVTSKKNKPSKKDQELNAKLNLGKVASVHQDKKKLTVVLGKNQTLTQEQYDAIVDYATRNHLKVMGLPKQVNASHKTTASDGDVSDQFFTKGSTKKGGAHDGDSIILNGDTLTISQDASKYHYLTKAESDKLLDYIKANKLKVVDNTVTSIYSYIYADGTTKHKREKGYVSGDARVSDPLVYLLSDTNQSSGDSNWNAWLGMMGNQSNVTTVYVCSHSVFAAGASNEAPAADAYIVVGMYDDQDVHIDIIDGDQRVEVWNSANDKDNSFEVTNEYQKKVILTDAEVQALVRAEAYVVDHPGSILGLTQSASQKSSNGDPVTDLPLEVTNPYTGTVIVQIVDNNGNTLYVELDTASGGIIHVSDMNNLMDASGDVLASLDVDISEILNNLLNGMNPDGTPSDKTYVIDDDYEKGDSNEDNPTTDGKENVTISFSQAANGDYIITYHLRDTTTHPADVTIDFKDSDQGDAPAKDKGGKLIPNVVKEGEEGDVIDYIIDVPDGYVLDTDKTKGVTQDADGNYHISITLTGDDTDNVTIYLKEHVTPMPAPDDDHPDDKHYAETHHTTTETIHHKNDKGETVHADTYKYAYWTRSYSVNDITGEVVGYGEWVLVTDKGDINPAYGMFNQPEGVPSAETTGGGYTWDGNSKGKKEVPMPDADNNGEDVEITLDYMRNPEKGTVNYVDEDGNPVDGADSQAIKGKYGTDTTITVTIPAGWEFDEEANAKEDWYVSYKDGVITYTFKEGANDLTIHLKRKAESTTVGYVDDNDNQSKVDGINDDHNTINGQFGKNGVYNLSNDDLGNYELDNDKNQDEWWWQYYDAKTGQINFPFADGDANKPITIHLKHQSRDIKPDDPTDPDFPENNDTYKEATHGSVTRTITYHNPDGTSTTKTETLNFERTITIDAVTGVITGYGDWEAVDGDTFTDAVTPEIAGYTPDKDKITGETVTGDDKDLKYDVYYTANDETTTVDYYDDTDKKDDVAIDTDDNKTINGKFDANGNYVIGDLGNYELSDANSSEWWWQYYDADTNTINFPFKDSVDNDNKIVIHVVHSTTDITPGGDDAVNPGDKYYDDTHSTSTRTIHYVDDKGNKLLDPTQQTGNWTRTGVLDNVTGEITWGDWTFIASDDDTEKAGTFDAVDAPEIPGFHVDKNDAVSDVITQGEDSDVNITYVADDEEVTVDYYDDTDKKDDVAIDTDDNKTIDGKYDENGNYVLADFASKGYKLGDNTGEWWWQYYDADTNTINFPFKDGVNNGKQIKIHLEHDTRHVDPDDSDANSEDSKYYNDTHKTWNEDIHYTYDTEKGKKAADDVHQEVDFTRGVDVDAVTGEVIPGSEGDWTPTDGDGQVPDVPSPEIPGYTPSTKVVPGTDADPNGDGVTIYVVYTANDDTTAEISYQDSDNNDKEVKHDQITGTTDTEGNFTFDVPAGYVVDPDRSSAYTQYKNGDQITITIKGDDSDNVVIYLKHAEESATVHFVDDKGNAVTDADGNPVTVTINGHYSEDGKYVIDSADYPKGWVLDDDINPDGWAQGTEIDFTFADDDSDDITIHLTHGKKDIDPDNPVDPDFPDNNDKYNKATHDSVTRTIVYHNPDGTTTTKTETLDFERSITIDTVTGEIIGYGDWKAVDGDTFASEKPDQIAGYTTNPDEIPAKTVTGDSEDFTVDVYYAADTDTETTITYVDEDGNIIKTDVPTGTTDAEGHYKIDVPKGWVIDTDNKDNDASWKDGGTIDYTVRADDSDDIVIHIKHGKKSVDPDNPVDPDFPDQSDNYKNATNSTVTRTITYHNPDGTTTTKTETIHFQRTVDYDAVTGEIIPGTEGEWYIADDSEISDNFFDAVTPTAIPGYTAVVSGDGSSIDKKTVDGDSDDLNYDVNYVANDDTETTITYVDDEGNIIKTDVQQGTTDKNGEYTIDVPKGWVIDPDNKGNDASWKDGGTITYVVRADDSDDIVIHLIHGKKDIDPDNPVDPDFPDNSDEYNKATHDSVTRTIVYHNPDGTTTTKTETIDFERSITIDALTGDIIGYGDWEAVDGDTFAKETPDQIAGYTTNPDEIPAKTVTGDSEDFTVDIYYAADTDTETTITYVDENGKEIKVDVQTGTTDAEGHYKIDVPKGWVIDTDNKDNDASWKDGGTIDYTVRADDSDDIVIHIKHGKKSVDPDNPVDPDFPDQSDNYKNATNSTVTRTITYHNPDGSTTTKTETIHFQRTVDYDAVTGEIIPGTEGEWYVADDSEISNNFFDAVTPTAIPGYTAVVSGDGSSIDKKTVDGDSDDLNYDVNYTANTDTETTITYVDDEGNIIKTDVQQGTTDKNGEYTIHVPKGWVIDPDNKGNDASWKDGGTISYTVRADDSDDIVIHLIHGKKDIDPDNPVDPDFPDNSDEYNKATHDSVTRTIVYHNPDGTTTTKTETIDFERSITIDALTGDIIGYGDWEAVDGDTFAKETPDQIAGYTTNPDEIPAKTVTGDSEDFTVDIYYAADTDTETTITYVDENGKEIKVDVQTGTTDAEGHYKIDVPKGWVIDTDNKDNDASWKDGGTIDYTVRADDSDDIVIHLTHGKKDIDPDNPVDPDFPDNNDKYNEATHDSVTRTIVYHNPDGTTTTKTETIDFERTITIDTVTGDIIGYGDWEAVDGDTFTDAVTPEIAGYTPDKDKIAGETVKGGDDDLKYDVYYTANTDTKTTITYVDEDGNIIKTDVQPGKTDAEGNYTIDVPKGWVIDTDNKDNDASWTDGGTITYTVRADDSDDIVIHITHGNKDIDPDNPVDPDFPDNNDKYNDATHYTADETIHYVDENGNTIRPDDHVTVNYTRTITIDTVTGEIIGYGDWQVADGSTADFPARDTPEIPGYFTDQDSVAEIDVTPGETGDQDVTVIYYTTDQPVDPDDPKDDGDKVDPDDPNSPVYPDGVDYDDLHDSATETVNYYDAATGKLIGSKTETVNYKRSAVVHYNADGTVKDITYGDWVVDGKDFTDIDTPDKDGYFASTDTVKAYDPDLTGDDVVDHEDDVYYYSSDQPVDPDDPKDDGDKVDPDDPNSPIYPDGVNYDDLHDSATETVNYYDAATGEIIGTKTETVNYKRSAVVHYNADGSVKDVTYGDWVVDGDAHFTDIDTPDEDGYFASDDSVDAYNPDLTGDDVPDHTDKVYYYKTDEDITPDDPKHDGDDVDPEDPDSPVYPDGVDYDDLHDSATETVNYYDAATGKLIGSKTETVNYTRTAHIHHNADGSWTVTYGDWVVDGKDFTDIDTPDKAGYFTSDDVVEAYDPDLTGDDVADHTDNVYYYKNDVPVDPDDPKDDGDKVDPEDPDSPVYPDGVNYDDLHDSATETVNYYDAETGKLIGSKTETVNYKRSAVVHYNADGSVKDVTYGDWVVDGTDFTDIDTPDKDGYFSSTDTVKAYDPDLTGDDVADHTDNVYYYSTDQDVTPDDPKDDGDKVNPDDPNSPVYPDGVSYDDLNRDSTETIHYVDAETGEVLADTYTNTVHYTRTAHVHYNADGTTTVTYGDWVADGEYGTVDSPIIDGYVADRTSVTASAEDGDTDVTVYYYDADRTIEPDGSKDQGDKVDPSNPNSPVYPSGVSYDDLNRDVTETINYVDENGNPMADSYTKTIHYTREAHVHFNADGTATVTYGPWHADGSFDSVDSPDIDGYTADQSVVDGLDLDNPDGDVNITVTYHKDAEEVVPAEPTEPAAPAPHKQTRATRYGHVKLPQTGESDNTEMSELGVLGLLAASLGIFGLAKRRKRDGED
jgi:LPXTG-motif cell wall-anchored protein